MIKKILLSVIGLLILALTATAVWMTIPFPYQEGVVNKALIDSESVAVSTEPWIVFTPKKIINNTGIIFYPGGKTTATTFAPVIKKYAEQGYLSVITPMPLKTAFLGINKADDVIAAYPEITHWVIAGHSLGGVGASEYVKKADVNKVKGLLLWASYPASDISQLPINVLSISANKDLQSTPEKINSNKSKLPQTTQYIEIAGGNHGQFGYYDLKNNQQTDLITFEEQQQQILAASLAFLRQISVSK